MKFNLAVSSALCTIRRACPDLKAEDIADLSREKILSLAKLIEKKAFGPGGSLGPSWVQVDNHDPYQSSYYTTAVPQFGGDTLGPKRRDFDRNTSNSNQTNKDKNVDEQTRGTSEDAIPDLKRLRLMEQMPSVEPEFEYIVSFSLRPWDNEEELKKILGDDAETDGRDVMVVVQCYEDAISRQRGLPGSIVTRRMRRSE